MLSELLASRNLPEGSADFHNWADRRSQILEQLCREEYGFLPAPPDQVTGEVVEEDRRFCAGKAPLKKVKLTVLVKGRQFSFPIYCVFPNGRENVPFFIHINFRDSVPDKYMPTEELIDSGYGVLSFGYKDVTSDDGDMTNGLAGIIYPDGTRRPEDCGKIGLWSWAASRVLDYAQTLPQLNLNRAIVAGHSRLGKTALLTGALDERFYCAVSNDSGCSGAAITRQKQGEHIEDIVDRFPYWFCENYKQYAGREEQLPFDQHQLLAAMAPRRVYVASAEEDSWADPVSEYLSCVAAGAAYKPFGLTGFLHPDRLPVAGDTFHQGEIGYHLRSGCHYFSREDWRHLIEFLTLAEQNNQSFKYWKIPENTES